MARRAIPIGGFDSTWPLINQATSPCSKPPVLTLSKGTYKAHSGGDSQKIKRANLASLPHLPRQVFLRHVSPELWGVWFVDVACVNRENCGDVMRMDSRAFDALIPQFFVLIQCGHRSAVRRVLGWRNAYDSWVGTNDHGEKILKKIKINKK